MKLGEPPRTARQIVAGVARVLAAGDPRVWQRLLTDHVADDAGDCTVCRLNGVGGSVWPCTLRSIAEDAHRLAHRCAD